MAMTKTRMTVEEFIDAVANIRERAQLIDGVMVVDQPRFRHQDAVGEIYSALHAWQRAAPGRGQVSLPLDVILDRHDMYGPDVLWYADETRMEVDDYQRGMPDLVVEVSSPSTWHQDVGKKREMYELHGLPELWLVDTVRCNARVLRRSTADAPGFDVDTKVAYDEVLTSPQLPGFELPLREVFRL
jgi:Uma2 family endonuclease